MADDLGDSHPNSLGQGGACPRTQQQCGPLGRFLRERENGDDQRVSSILDQWLRVLVVRQLRRAAHDVIGVAISH